MSDDFNKVRYMVFLEQAVISTWDDVNIATNEATKAWALFAQVGQTVYVKDTQGNVCSAQKKY